jgi:PAS domain S-box-containing protein
MKQYEDEGSNVFSGTAVSVMQSMGEDGSNQLAANLKAIFDHTTEGLILLDTEGVLKAFNAKAIQNHKLTKNVNDLAVGKKLVDYIEGSRKIYFESLIAQVLLGETIAYDIDYEGEGNKKHWFHTTLSPVREKGTITGICLVRTEITARKNAEELIRQSEEKYHNLFESSPLPMWVIDIESFLFLDANEAATKLLGYSKEELLEMRIDSLWTDESREQNRKKVQLYKFDDTTVQAVIQYRTKNDRVITADISSQPLEFDQKKARLTQAKDITEKLETERIIQLSEQRFRALVQEGADLIGILNADADFEYLSPNSSSIVGTPSEFFIGKNALQFIHEEDQERVMNSFNLMDVQKQVSIEPFRFKGTGSQWLWMETIATNMMDDSSVGGIVVNSRNVTEKIEQQIKLKESNDRYDTLAKATSDTIWDWDISSNKMHYSNGMFQMFGYKQSDVENVADWWKQKIHPDDQASVSAAVKELFEKKETNLQIEYRFRSADGSYKDVLDRGFLLTDKEGNPLRMIGAMQDISERKKTENEIKQINERFELATRAINDAVFEWDIVEDTTYWGEGLETIFGHKRTVGRMDPSIWSKNVHPDELEDLKESLRHSFAKHLPTNSREYRFRCSDGSYKTVFDKSIILYNNEGQPVKMIGAIQDVTELRKREHERELLIQELTQNNKNLKQFSYITSHNLRAPISNLLGLLQLVDKSKIADPLLLEILDGFKTSTELLNDTINDLAKVLVIKNNAAVPQENIVLQDMLDKVLGQIKNLIDEHQPVIKTGFDEVKSIHFSSTYMESIFLNLLTNAIKYQSPDRKLKIDIDAYYESDDRIIFVFTDNGIGLDVERYKDRLFGLYQRFHNHPDSRGLGLYLVRSQLESLGGSIDIKSKVGEGTSFILTFKR